MGLTKSSPARAEDIATEKKDVTRITSNKFKYTWVIENFLNCSHPVGQYLQSPTFTTGEHDEFEWVLRLYPNGCDMHKESRYYLALKLCLLTENWPDDVSITLSLLRNNEKCGAINTLLDDLQYKLPMNDERVKLENGYLIRILADSISTKDYISSNKALTVTCEIIRCNHNIHNEYDSRELIWKIPAAQRLIEFDDFERLMETGEFSDVLVIVGHTDFHVHRNILAARSRVFSAMFQHEMTERNNGIARITDIDAEVMQEVLRFVYTGKVNNLRILASELLDAADKYELNGLKAVCEEVIANYLNVENIGAILTILDTRDCDTKKLRKAPFLFLLKRAGFLINRDNFHKIMRSLSSTLMVDIISLLLTKYSIHK